MTQDLNLWEQLKHDALFSISDALSSRRERQMFISADNVSVMWGRTGCRGNKLLKKTAGCM